MYSGDGEVLVFLNLLKSKEKALEQDFNVVNIDSKPTVRYHFVR